MTRIAGHDRGQKLLLPEAVDDYVAADNRVRFIDAFVDGLDLAAAGFVRVMPEATGRPGYAPSDLRLSEPVRSSRRLEAETRRNLELVAASMVLPFAFLSRRPLAGWPLINEPSS